MGRFQGLPFTWVVGPATLPDDLPTYLQAHGMNPGPTLDGMVMRPPLGDRPGRQRWAVHRAPWTEVLDHASTLAPAYGHRMSAEAFHHVVRSLGQSASGASEIYLAVADDLRTPIGFGVTVPVNDRAVFLSGSATLPEWRHQGVYRSLVLQRVHDTFQAGMEAALITAVTTTSVPICRRLGFESVCQIQQWYGHQVPSPPHS